MNEARCEHICSCDNCEKMDIETAKEYLCPDCEDAKDSEAAIEIIREERDTARLTRDYYLRKVNELETKNIKLTSNNEYLKREIARKNEQVEFLR